MAKAVHMVDNSGSTSCSIISCLGSEIVVQINHLLTKFLPLNDRGSGNYATPYRVLKLPCNEQKSVSCSA